mmetsp:Transcript_15453/g.23986  ORF Transcript_15453/g.23986 Transcript_15453/m.23986 type:complete len:234 (+) Transcript_15453:1922-2623(+)
MLAFSKCIHAPILGDNARIIIAARHVDTLGMKQRRHEYRLQMHLNSPEEKFTLIGNTRSMTMPSCNLGHSTPLQLPLNRSGHSSHTVHIHHNTTTTTELTLIIPPPAMYYTIICKCERKLMPTSNLNNLTTSQHLHRLQKELIFRIQITQTTPRTRPSRQQLTLSRQHSRMTLTNTDILYKAPIFHQTLHPLRFQMFRAITMTETAHTIEGRSTETKGVQITPLIDERGMIVT